ncbi:undecaprenyl-diphosphate phosphatase [Alkalihalobacillus pseudalcaliphilus]|uniref:undecaprenyl-diphosphate phosphatase n=1 Tax=Alkalihalobacillus pseudalcaliphilus TaxID=79884 RepID=UPI00064E1229|nr:undecaprenyl-diphosphate phosphatase [Alkalihalobacillus pseudalcaliphilus]KMK76900.1 UDP pyrophosphate phosphatase [Alkalihalobacillus pseudalcaliphilus]
MESLGQLAEWVQYLILGLIQGITEPIPVSSSGHLVLAQYFFGLESEGLTFEILVNFASLIAVIFIYRKDLIRLIGGALRYLQTKSSDYENDFRFWVYLVIATVPAAIAGLLLEDWISTQTGRISIIAIALLVTGVALFIIRKLKGTKTESDMTLKAVIIVGLAQMVALMPGISRSGATIVAALAVGWSRDLALRFSFFLYIPVSLGSGILALNDVFNDPQFAEKIFLYSIAFVASLFASYFALKIFINIMKSGKLIYFSIYCFIVGFGVLGYLMFR